MLEKVVLIRFCAENWSRTNIACSSDKCLDHLGYLGALTIQTLICANPVTVSAYYITFSDFSLNFIK